MIGRAVSHYRVISALGSGGMGVVYLAEDERLGRHVALKFLPTESATNRQALERFRVEARAASSLSHPGICAIYDIGEDAGTPFIVMEVLKGESLRDRISRGPLKVADLLDIGIQLADALDAAHSQGIIHRDIKPSNIFVGDKNRTKILDFGLAKLSLVGTALSSGGATKLDASTRRDLTMPGSAVGTVSYMSPEQARGEDVDTRTDLFSLGVVLYEMASGIQAFTGSTQAVVFDAILNRTPHPVSHFNPLIPPRLEALIGTALEKDRDLRHQHASDLEAELKRIRRDLESGTLVGASRTAVHPAAERRSSAGSHAPAPQPRRWWMYGAAAIGAVAVIAAGFNLWSEISQRGTTEPSVTVLAPEEPPREQTTPTAPLPSPQPEASAPPAAPAPPPARAAQSTPSARPTPTEPRPQAMQPSPTPQRTPDVPPPVATLAPPAPSVAQTPAPSPAETTNPDAAKPDAGTAPAATPQQPSTPALADPPVTQPPPRATAAPTSPAIPLSSPVEKDDAAIRGVVRTYERAIETKSIELFRSVRPALSAAEEARLRDSFRQVDSQQIDVVVEELRIEGRTATVRLSRRDTIVNAGRRQTASSRQTLRLDKTASGWIITEILGR